MKRDHGWSDLRIMHELQSDTVPSVEEFLDDFFELRDEYALLYKRFEEAQKENEELKEQIKQMTIEEDDETSYSM
jgi:cell shape-determining protein MreC